MSEERARSQLLESQMRIAFDDVHDRMEGLTDDELFWSPVDKSWTVRQEENGAWFLDYATDDNWPDWRDPQPPPFCTIGHRLGHLGSCKIMYHDYAFGPATGSWGDPALAPHTAADGIALFEEGQSRLMSAVAGLNDADLDVERKTNWGTMLPTKQLLWIMIHHDMQHGNEIAVVRDLYRHMVSG